MTNKTLGWIAWHPTIGFADRYGEDGVKYDVFDEIDKELIEDIKELNDEDTKQEWKAVKVEIRKVE